MNWYNPYSTNQQYENYNSIQPQQISQYPQTSSEEVPSSVNPSVATYYRYDNEYRAGRAFVQSGFRGKQYFKQTIPVPDVTPFSAVFASITEEGIFGGQVKPFLGAASLEIFNVVPEDGKVTVTGRIWWDSDLNYRISLVVF